MAPKAASLFAQPATAAGSDSSGATSAQQYGVLATFASHTFNDGPGAKFTVTDLQAVRSNFVGKRSHPLNTLTVRHTQTMLMEAVPEKLQLQETGLKPAGAKGNSVGAVTWAWVYGAAGPGAAEHVSNIGFAIIEQAYLGASMQASDGSWGAKAEKTSTKLLMKRHGHGQNGKWHMTDELSFTILLDKTLPPTMRTKFHQLARKHAAFMTCEDVHISKFYEVTAGARSLKAGDIFQRAAPASAPGPPVASAPVKRRPAAAVGGGAHAPVKRRPAPAVGGGARKRPATASR